MAEKVEKEDIQLMKDMSQKLRSRVDTFGSYYNQFAYDKRDNDDDYIIIGMLNNLATLIEDGVLVPALKKKTKNNTEQYVEKGIET